MDAYIVAFIIIMDDMRLLWNLWEIPMYKIFKTVHQCSVESEIAIGMKII